MVRKEKIKINIKLKKTVIKNILTEFTLKYDIISLQEPYKYVISVVRLKPHRTHYFNYISNLSQKQKFYVKLKEEN